MKNTIIKQKLKEPSVRCDVTLGDEKELKEHSYRSWCTSTHVHHIIANVFFRVHIVDRTRYLCIVCMNISTYVYMFVRREGVESRSVGRVSTKIKEHTHVLCEYVFVCVCRCLACVCVWFIKVAYTSILFIEQLFLIDLCHFFTGIHNPQLRLHWTIADDGGGEIGFQFGFARLKHSLHFLIHFTRATTRIFMQLWTTREWKTNRKMLKSVLKRGRCACMLLSLHLFVGYARVCHKKTVRAAQANNHVRSQRVFLAFWESMHMCVFVSVGCVVSFAGALSRTQPNATARIHRQ